MATDNSEDAAQRALQGAQAFFGGAIAEFQKIDWNEVANSPAVVNIKQGAEAAFEGAKAGFGEAVNGIQNIDWEEVANSPAANNIKQGAEAAFEGAKTKVDEVVADVQKIDWDEVANSPAVRNIKQGAENAFEGAKTSFGQAITGLQNLKWEDVPEPVRKYIEENPALTAIQIALLITAICPGLVVTPALRLVGLSSQGPVTGMFLDSCKDAEAILLTCHIVASYAAWYQ